MTNSGRRSGDSRGSTLGGEDDGYAPADSRVAQPSSPNQQQLSPEPRNLQFETKRRRRPLRAILVLASVALLLLVVYSLVAAAIEASWDNSATALLPDRREKAIEEMAAERGMPVETTRWYVDNRRVLSEMFGSASDLFVALKAKDGQNIIRFCSDLSAKAGDLLVSNPPEAAEAIVVAAMGISGEASNAYISNDYGPISQLYDEYSLLQAQVLAEVSTTPAETVPGG